MKAFEFRGCLQADGTMRVPSEIAAQMHLEQAVRVILLIPEGDENADWAALTAEQFLKGYAEGDAIYDQLSAG
jgi:hypothetical protein